MRVLCGCVLALTLAGSAEGLTSMRHHSHSHSHSHSRLHSHIVSHDTVSADSAPCGAGYVRVFQPQLGCAHLSAPKEVVDLVVVTESTCKDVLQGIRTKTAPYWDLEMNRCADESRKGLLTQCATKIGSNFSTSLQALCHFDTKVLDSAFHKPTIVSSLPSVEVPTGAFVPGQLVQKRTPLSVNQEKTLDANTHPDPKTPEKPIEKFADYPTPLTASAQRLAALAQHNSNCLGANGLHVPCDALAHKPATQIQSFTYSDVQSAAMPATPDEPVIVGTADNTGRVRTTSWETVVPAGAVKVAAKSAEPAVPNEKWARYPSSHPTAAATSMAISAQQASGVLPSAPTVITVHRAN